MKHIRRSFIRNYHQAPVEVRGYDSSGSFRALMNDCCRGGMQLSTEQFLEPGAAVVIQARDLRDIFQYEAIRHGYPAEVVWCRRHIGSCPNQFSVGVQFIATGESRPRPIAESRDPLGTLPQSR